LLPSMALSYGQPAALAFGRGVRWEGACFLRDVRWVPFFPGNARPTHWLLGGIAPRESLEARGDSGGVGYPFRPVADQSASVPLSSRPIRLE
jgi:hypothetical protein